MDAVIYGVRRLDAAFAFAIEPFKPQRNIRAANEKLRRAAALHKLE